MQPTLAQGSEQIMKEYSYSYILTISYLQIKATNQPQKPTTNINAPSK